MLRRVSDTLLGIDLLEIQLEIIQSETGPNVRGLEDRVAAAHQELDRLERLLREQAQHLGIDSSSPIWHLRAVLSRCADRRQQRGGTGLMLLDQRRRDRRQGPCRQPLAREVLERVG
jgi:hypothetical protein